MMPSTALYRCRLFVGKGSFLRANAPYDNIIWNTWFTSNSEESVVTTPQGNHAVVAGHGGGIYASPERFERTYRVSVDRSNTEVFTGQKPSSWISRWRGSRHVATIHSMS